MLKIYAKKSLFFSGTIMAPQAGILVFAGTKRTPLDEIISSG